jgi:hypothetical protein
MTMILGIRQQPTMQSGSSDSNETWVWLLPRMDLDFRNLCPPGKLDLVVLVSLLHTCAHKLL